MKGYSHTKKSGSSVWLGGGGPRSKGAPNYNFLNYCIGVILLYAIRKISLLRAFWYQDHPNRTTTTCDMATGRLLGQPGAPKFGEALKWAPMAPQVWKLTHIVLPWIQTLVQNKSHQKDNISPPAAVCKVTTSKYAILYVMRVECFWRSITFFTHKRFTMVASIWNGK